MAPIRAVLLDIDGTLVDSNDLHAQAWKDVLDKEGFVVPFERVRGLIGKGGDKLLPELTGLDHESPRAKAMSQARGELFLRSYVPRVVPFPRVRELLLAMREHGLGLITATSAAGEELGPLLERAGVRDLLQGETGADDAEHSKPDPDIVQAALHKAGVKASEALLLGDTPYDLEAATRAGVGFVGLRSGGYGDHDLRGALAVYDDAADLLEHYASSPFA